MAGRTDLKIPYGIADFKRIRNEGWYYVDKTEYLAKLGAWKGHTPVMGL